MRLHKYRKSAKPIRYEIIRPVVNYLINFCIKTGSNVIHISKAIGRRAIEIFQTASSIKYPPLTYASSANFLTYTITVIDGICGIYLSTDECSCRTTRWNEKRLV